MEGLYTIYSLVVLEVERAGARARGVIYILIHKSGIVAARGAHAAGDRPGPSDGVLTAVSRLACKRGGASGVQAVSVLVVAGAGGGSRALRRTAFAVATART